MQVRCITNRIDTIESDPIRSRLERSIHVDGHLAGLDLGAVYTVIAIESRDGGIWVLLENEALDGSVWPYPLEYFEVIDSRIPTDWRVRFKHSENGWTFDQLSFQAWVDDPSFYEKLFDEDPNAVALYSKQRPA